LRDLRDARADPHKQPGAPHPGHRRAREAKAPIPWPYTRSNTRHRRTAHRPHREDNKNSDPGTMVGKRVATRIHFEYSAESAGNQRKHFAPSAAPLQDPRPAPRKSPQSTRLCLPANRKQAFALQPPLRRKRGAHFTCWGADFNGGLSLSSKGRASRLVSIVLEPGTRWILLGCPDQTQSFVTS
jgi:hypothetical protein